MTRGEGDLLVTCDVYKVFTGCTEQRSASTASSRSATQEIPCFMEPEV